jgi:hypothetical protein
VHNRDPDLGQPIGKGDAAAPPILLAKLARGQEIELTCRAYKVSGLILRILRKGATGLCGAIIYRDIHSHGSTKQGAKGQWTLTYRALPNITPNGRQSPLLALNTTLIISCGIQLTGLKKMVGYFIILLVTGSLPVTAHTDPTPSISKL